MDIRGCSMVSMPLMMAWVLALTGGITLITTTPLVDGQLFPICGNQLSPCMDYINSTTSNPPDICCNPMRDLAATQKSCFCKIGLTPPGILKDYGINIAHALRLLHSCGLNFDITSCKASSSALAPSVQVQPPATPGGDEGGAGRVTFTGFCIVLFIWAYQLFN